MVRAMTLGPRTFWTLLVLLWAAVARAAGPAPDSVAPSPDSAAAESARADSARAAVGSPALAPDTAAAAALLEAAETAPPETALAAPAAPAPVFLGGREVFRVRASRDGLTPAERAAAIRARLNRAVGDRSVPVDSVRLVASPTGIEVRLGPYLLWVVSPGDLETSDPSEIALRLASLPQDVRAGIAREREGRTPIRLVLSAVAAVLIALLAWVALRLLLAMSRRWSRWLRFVVGTRIPSLRFRGFEVLSSGQIAAFVTGVLRRLDLVVGLLLLYVFLTAEFSLFPWTQGWSWLLVHFATQQVLDLLRGVWSAVPGLFTIVVIVVAFRWLAQLSDRFFDALSAGTVVIGGFHPELAKPSRRLARILLWIIAVMVAYPYIPGAQSKAVQGVSILIGLMVSLGSTGFVGNVISGIVLTYSRSFRVGERVRIGDHVGDVVSLGFFATKLRSIRNEEITLPNGQVASSSIVNYSRLAAEPGLVLHTEVTLGYDVDWRRVHALLIEAAGAVEGVEPEPPPRVFQRSLGDSNVTYEITCTTRDSHDQLRLYSDLHASIQDAFARAGIEILSPDYHAVRDANAPVLPQEPGGPRPAPGGFRVRPAPEEPA